MKQSAYAPQICVTDAVNLADRVEIAVGGQFVLAPDQQKLLLIAGGVGIAPLMCMLRAMDHSPPRSTTLLYSARTSVEHIFKKELQQLEADNETLKCNFITTREGTQRMRINRRLILKTLKQIGDIEGLKIYVSGPGGMPELMVKECEACGLDKS